MQIKIDLEQISYLSFKKITHFRLYLDVFMPLSVSMAESLLIPHLIVSAVAKSALSIFILFVSVTHVVAVHKTVVTKDCQIGGHAVETGETYFRRGLPNLTTTHR